MKNDFINKIKKNNLTDFQKEKLNKYLIESYKETSSELITVRLNPYEKKILKKAAASKNMNLTDVIKLYIIKDLYLNNE